MNFNHFERWFVCYTCFWRDRRESLPGELITTKGLGVKTVRGKMAVSPLFHPPFSRVIIISFFLPPPLNILFYHIFYSAFRWWAFFFYFWALPSVKVLSQPISEYMTIKGNPQTGFPPPKKKPVQSVRWRSHTDSNCCPLLCFSLI